MIPRARIGSQSVADEAEGLVKNNETKRPGQK